MSEAISTALTLMSIGMIMVFIVLAVVVYLGHFLIWFVNRFTPDVAATSKSNEDANDIHPSIVAVITAAVDEVTKGKGRISKIERR